MLLYLVTYDIPCNKRRQKIANLLEGYGRRVQYSVFECVLPPLKYRELRERLRPHVKIEVDSVRFYPLSGHTLGQVEVWGGSAVLTPPASIIV